MGLEIIDINPFVVSNATQYNEIRTPMRVTKQDKKQSLLTLHRAFFQRAVVLELADLVAGHEERAVLVGLAKANRAKVGRAHQHVRVESFERELARHAAPRTSKLIAQAKKHTQTKHGIL